VKPTEVICLQGDLDNLRQRQQGHLELSRSSLFYASHIGAVDLLLFTRWTRPWWNERFNADARAAFTKPCPPKVTMESNVSKRWFIKRWSKGRS